jgi:hypothetical protein
MRPDLGDHLDLEVALDVGVARRSTSNVCDTSQRATPPGLLLVLQALVE